MTDHICDPINWIALTNLPGIGPITLRRWLEQSGDIKTIFSATPEDLTAAGFHSAQIQSLKNIDWHKAEADMTWCENNNCHLINMTDSLYPALLKETYDAPALLYVQGDPHLLSQPQLAIVGSRNPTATGKELADSFAANLARAGLVITSGLALGVDGASHRAALMCKGKTIAVMGTGLQYIYPRSHQKLAEEIIETGALVSEFPLAALPVAHHFPRRNRVISGLSLGVLVIEAALQSGSLITARMAMEQNRDVFAIPGSIHNPLARGCHQLIRQGAKLVETANDILEEIAVLGLEVMEPLHSKRQNSINLSLIQQQVLAKIGYEVTPIDVIIARSGLTAGKLSSILLSLELAQCVRLVAGGYLRQAE